MEKLDGFPVPVSSVSDQEVIVDQGTEADPEEVSVNEGAVANLEVNGNQGTETITEVNGNGNERAAVTDQDQEVNVAERTETIPEVNVNQGTETNPEVNENQGTNAGPEVNVTEEVAAVTEVESRIHDIVPKEQLIKILECPICFEIPFPPILTCVQGHIVCSTCRPRMTKCGVCRGQFQEGRNYPLEEIILGSSFPCKFKEFGCKDFILGKIFSNHLQICQFNPFFVLCNENRGTPCKNAWIPSSHYFEHLKGQHKYTTGIHGEQCMECMHSFVQVDDSTRMGQMIRTDYFELIGEAFVQKWEFENNLYYTWFCMLNSTEKAREALEVTVSVSSTILAKKNKATFSSFLALQDASLSLNAIKATGQFLALHPNQILGFGGTGEIKIEDRTWDLYWNSKILIHRRTSKTPSRTRRGTPVIVIEDEDWS